MDIIKYTITCVRVYVIMSYITKPYIDYFK